MTHKSPPPILSFEMKPVLLLAALAAMMTVPAALSSDTPGDGTLSVKRGRGMVAIKFRGTVIGRLANGNVRIRDFHPLDGNDPQFLGCKKLRPVTFTTTLCQGKKISFRALDGRYNVTLRGSGIFLSVVGKGSVTIDGTGDLGLADGQMSWNNGPYESLPDFATSYMLAAPQPGG